MLAYHVARKRKTQRILLHALFCQINLAHGCLHCVADAASKGVLQVTRSHPFKQRGRRGYGARSMRIRGVVQAA